jgi:iron complex outermembrane receptor protein
MSAVLQRISGHGNASGNIASSTFKYRPLTLAVLLTLSGLAFAVAPAEETGDRTARGDTTITLGTFKVTGSEQESGQLAASDLPSSVDIVGGDQIETENVDFSVGLMKKVPGTYFGDWNQGVISGSVSFRGYDTNNVQPFTLVVDGIPHHFDLLGRADFQPFFSLEIERIELVRGTIDPRFGHGNVAGTLSIFTKKDWDLTQIRLLAGEHNTREAQMVGGANDGNFSQTYFIGLRSSDGYRDHSDMRKGAMSGKWFYTSDDKRLRTGIIARAFTMDADAPGYLSLADAESGPLSSVEFSASDGGTQDNNHVSAHFDYNLTNAVDLSIKAYTQDFDRTRWARFSLAGTQQEEINQTRNTGIIANLSHANSNIPGFDRVTFNIGADYTNFSATVRHYNTENRVRQDIFRDWDFDWNSWGAYVSADGEVNKWLRLTAALRSDSFSGDFTNILAGQQSGMVDLKNILQPKIGAILTPADNYSVYANWGRTFQLPANPDIYGQTAAGALISRNISESQNDGWEVGIKASPIEPIDVRLAYWSMTASGELVNVDGTSDKMNGGETERKGVDFALNARLHPWVSLWGSLSLVDAIYKKPAPGLENRTGKKLEMVPEYTAKVGVDFNHPSGASANLWLDITDDYYPILGDIDLRDREAGGYEIAHFSASYLVQPSMQVGLDIRNVFDKDHFSWAWAHDRGVQPGQPRSFYGWVRFEYQ